MADTPNLKRYVKQLSYKLRDSVASENGLADGKIFTLALKLDYLNRAYADLKMQLSSIVTGIERIFPDFYQIAVKTIGGNSNTTTQNLPDNLVAPTTPSTVKIKDMAIGLSELGLAENVFEIVDLYISVNTTGSTYAYKQAGRINAENYFGAVYGSTTQYKSNDTAFKYFYSVIDGKIKFTGGDKACNQLTVFAEAPVPEFTVDGPKDLVVPKFYEKLYLTLATIEAMLDKGDQEGLTKAVAYSKQAQGMIALIELREKTVQKRETDRTR